MPLPMPLPMRGDAESTETSRTSDGVAKVALSTWTLRSTIEGEEDAVQPSEEILAQVPMDQLAQQLGVDQPTAETAAREAVSSLLGGMQSGAGDESGAQSLLGALDQHAGSNLLDGGVQLDQVDTADGEKIVQKVYGSDSGAVAQRLSSGQVSNTLIKKVLPILAPIVLAWLAKNVLGRGQGQAGQGGQGQGGLMDVLGQVLGGILGGGAGQSPFDPQGTPQQAPPPQQAPTDQAPPAQAPPTQTPPTQAPNDQAPPAPGGNDTKINTIPGPR